MSTNKINRRQFVAAASISSLAALNITPALGAKLNSEFDSVKKEKPTWKKNWRFHLWC